MNYLCDGIFQSSNADFSSSQTNKTRDDVQLTFCKLTPRGRVAPDIKKMFQFHCDRKTGKCGIFCRKPSLKCLGDVQPNLCHVLHIQTDPSEMRGTCLAEFLVICDSHDEAHAKYFYRRKYLFIESINNQIHL